MTTEIQRVKYLVKGGSPVCGSIKCMGAKNFATKAMVASLLTENKTTLCNVPLIGDVEITQKLLESLGVNIQNTNDGTLEMLIMHHYQILVPIEFLFYF